MSRGGGLFRRWETKAFQGCTKGRKDRVSISRPIRSSMACTHTHFIDGPRSTFERELLQMVPGPWALRRGSTHTDGTAAMDSWTTLIRHQLRVDNTRRVVEKSDSSSGTGSGCPDNQTKESPMISHLGNPMSHTREVPPSKPVVDRDLGLIRPDLARSLFPSPSRVMMTRDNNDQLIELNRLGCVL